MNNKVTIIVAAYNVDKYIEECILSILNQTYQNIEIIVVDDCSTDNTSSICDSFCLKDSRVRIIHNKVNFGVSKTRNIALNLASGKYVVFVDGDDSLCPDYVDYMLNLMKITQGEMCLSINCYHDKRENQTEIDTVEKLTSERATALLLSQDVDVGCWNKIYNREFLISHNIRFAEDLFYGEGLQFITSVSMYAKAIGVGKRKVYFYRRTNTESATIKFNIDKYKNGWESLLRIKSKIKIDDDELKSRLFEHMNLFAINSMLGIIQNRGKRLYAEEYKFWKKYIHANVRSFLSNNYINVKQKIKMVLMIISPDLFAYYSLEKKKRILRGKRKEKTNSREARENV